MTTSYDGNIVTLNNGNTRIVFSFDKKDDMLDFADLFYTGKDKQVFCEVSNLRVFVTNEHGTFTIIEKQ